MVDDIEDPRRYEPSGVGAEREMLEEWLEFHRTTLLLKCEGVDEAVKSQRVVYELIRGSVEKPTR